jgi:hypothetical protein
LKARDLKGFGGSNPSASAALTSGGAEQAIRIPPVPPMWLPFAAHTAGHAIAATSPATSVVVAA